MILLYIALFLGLYTWGWIVACNRAERDANCEGWHDGFHEGLDMYYEEHKRRFVLVELVRGLINDVKGRHPGEELTCPHMKALDANVNHWGVE